MDNQSYVEENAMVQKGANSKKGIARQATLIGFELSGAWYPVKYVIFGYGDVDVGEAGNS